MSFISAADGAQIYYKDWGSGPPVVLSHGWPLNSDSWEAQMLFLAGNGFRVIAHDRRGHGRSTQTWSGNDMDTYADDLAALIDALDLHDLALVGFSTGGGEVARYIGRHGTARVAKVVLVSAVPPFMLQTADNPGRRADRGVRRDPRRAAWPIARRPTRTWPTARSSGPTGQGRTRRVGCGTPSGCRACSPATATRSSASRRSPPPTSGPTSTGSTCRPWSSTATTTRWCRSTVGGRAFGRPDQGRETQGLPRRPARHHRHPQGGTLGRPADFPELVTSLAAEADSGDVDTVLLAGDANLTASSPSRGAAA